MSDERVYWQFRFVLFFIGFCKNVWFEELMVRTLKKFRDSWNNFKTSAKVSVLFPSNSEFYYFRHFNQAL